MKTLSKDLKRMLSALAYQDVGEWLPRREMTAVLGYGRSEPRPSKPQPVKTVTRRIALITDGRGQEAPLEFAIDAALRSNAAIDLLMHGVQDETLIGAMEQQVQKAGLSCRRIPLSTQPVEGIEAYVANTLSLIYLVAMPDDPPVQRLLEELWSGRGRHVTVPVVLVKDHFPVQQSSRSAA